MWRVAAPALGWGGETGLGLIKREKMVFVRWQGRVTD